MNKKILRPYEKVTSCVPFIQKIRSISMHLISMVAMRSNSMRPESMRLISMINLRYKKMYILFLFLLALGLLLGCMTSSRVGVVVPAEIPGIVALIKESNLGNPSLKVFVDSTDASGNTILISGLTNNASGAAASWNLNLDQNRGVSTFPTSISVAPPVVISPHSQENMVAYTVGTSRPVMYRVKTHVYGAAISDWLTSSSIGQFLGDVIFTTEYAGVTIPTQRVSGSSIALDGDRVFINDFANVPSGAFSVNASGRFPAGFSLTGNEGLADPDGAGIGALRNALLQGELRVSEVLRPDPGFAESDLQPAKSYSLTVNLESYPFSFSSENIQASFFRPNKVVGPIAQVALPTNIVVTENTEIDGAHSIRVTGFTNVPGVAVPPTFAPDPRTGSNIVAPQFSITLPAGYVLDGGVLETAIHNPPGSRNIAVSYESIIIREEASGLTRRYDISIDFFRFLQLQVVSGNIMPDNPQIPGTAVVGSGDFVTVTNSCELLARSTLSLLDNAGKIDPTVAVTSRLTSYFDVYNLDRVTMTNRNTTNYFITLNDVVLVGEGIGDFELFVEFPECALTGMGTPAAPYQITNSVHLNVLSYNLNNPALMAQFADKHYRITKDIDLGAFSDQESETPPWSRLSGGRGFYPIRDFRGTFDCNGHAISNLYINPTFREFENVGFFSSTLSATVEDCFFDNVYVSGGYRMGGVIGHMQESTLRSVEVRGVTIEKNACRGLLVPSAVRDFPYAVIHRCTPFGYSYDLQLSGVGGAVGTSDRGSIVDVSVIGFSYPEGVYFRTGGVVGNTSQTTVDGAYASGSLSGTRSGGLVGRLGSRVTIVADRTNVSKSILRNSFSEVDVSGSVIGGLVGVNEGDVQNSTSQGDVRGGVVVGGAVGYNRTVATTNGVVRNVIVNGDVSGYDDTGGLIGLNHNPNGRTHVSGFVNGKVTGMGGYEAGEYFGEQCLNRVILSLLGCFH